MSWPWIIAIGAGGGWALYALYRTGYRDGYGDGIEGRSERKW